MVNEGISIRDLFFTLGIQDEGLFDALDEINQLGYELIDTMETVSFTIDKTIRKISDAQFSKQIEALQELKNSFESIQTIPSQIESEFKPIEAIDIDNSNQQEIIKLLQEIRDNINTISVFNESEVIKPAPIVKEKTKDEIKAPTELELMNKSIQTNFNELTKIISELKEIKTKEDITVPKGIRGPLAHATREATNIYKQIYNVPVEGNEGKKTHELSRYQDQMSVLLKRLDNILKSNQLSGTRYDGGPLVDKLENILEKSQERFGIEAQRTKGFNISLQPTININVETNLDDITNAITQAFVREAIPQLEREIRQSVTRDLLSSIQRRG